MAPPPPPPTTDAAQADLGRFSLAQTPQLRELLAAVTKDPQAPQDLQQQCQQYLQQETVPWKLVQRAYTDVRRRSDQAGQQPALSDVCRGSTLLLPSPPARQRSKQLQERLSVLREAEEQRRYAAMVADVTQAEVAAASALDDPFFPTTKLQLSFGLHVIVTMAAFFALAFYGARLLAPGNPAWAALAGAVGLTAGLLLETALLILRQNMPVPLEQKYGHLMRSGAQQQQQQQQGAGPAQQQAAERRPQKQQQKQSSSSSKCQQPRETKKRL